MKKYNFTIIINQEGQFYVARCAELGVVSQGETIQESISNLKEAVSLYLEDKQEQEIDQYVQARPLISTFELEYA